MIPPPRGTSLRSFRVRTEAGTACHRRPPAWPRCAHRCRIDHLRSVRPCKPPGACRRGGPRVPTSTPGCSRRPRRHPETWWAATSPRRMPRRRSVRPSACPIAARRPLTAAPSRRRDRLPQARIGVTGEACLVGLVAAFGIRRQPYGECRQGDRCEQAATRYPRRLSAGQRHLLTIMCPAVTHPTGRPSGRPADVSGRSDRFPCHGPALGQPAAAP